MGKNKGYKALCTMIICIAVFCAAQIALFWFAFTPIKYVISGEKCPAVITVIGDEDDKNYIEAMYDRPNGRSGYAQVLTYGRPDHNEHFDAYVLEGEKKVFRMPAWWIVTAFFGGYTALMLITVIAGVRAQRVHSAMNQLSKYGKTAKGEIITVTKKRAFCFDCNVSFRDSEGTLQNAFLRFTRTVPKEGETCTVLYHITKNGRLLCENMEL